MRFQKYYGEPFRSDLRNVVNGLPPLHDHFSTEHETTVQPRMLSRANQAIRLLGSERLKLFATALYFTVLVDQVMYTHFHSTYPRFKSLTQYPKLRGDCPGGCSWMVDPSVILVTAGLPPASGERVALSAYADLVASASPVVELEVTSFFETHMPDVDGTDVWRHCLNNMPRGGR